MVIISPIKRQRFLGYQDSVFKVHPNFFHTIFFCGIHSRKNAWRMHGKRIPVRICRGRLRKNSNYRLHICTGKFIQDSTPKTFTFLDQKELSYKLDEQNNTVWKVVFDRSQNMSFPIPSPKSLKS